MAYKRYRHKFRLSFVIDSDCPADTINERQVMAVVVNRACEVLEGQVVESTCVRTGSETHERRWKSAK